MLDLDIKIDIVKLHKKGFSFTDIANYIEKEHNIKMSRQAVCSQYHRSMNDPFLNNDKGIEQSEIILDIVNYSAIGYSNNDIREILKACGIDIKLAYIKDVVQNSIHSISDVCNRNISKATEALAANTSKANIMESLAYKGKIPTDARLSYFINEAAEDIVVTAITDRIKEINIVRSNKDIIKHLEDRFCVGINI